MKKQLLISAICIFSIFVFSQKSFYGKPQITGFVKLSIPGGKYNPHEFSQLPIRYRRIKKLEQMAQRLKARLEELAKKKTIVNAYNELEDARMKAQDARFEDKEHQILMRENFEIMEKVSKDPKVIAAQQELDKFKQKVEERAVKLGTSVGEEWSKRQKEGDRLVSNLELAGEKRMKEDPKYKELKRKMVILKEKFEKQFGVAAKEAALKKLLGKEVIDTQKALDAAVEAAKKRL